MIQIYESPNGEWRILRQTENDSWVSQFGTAYFIVKYKGTEQDDREDIINWSIMREKTSLENCFRYLRYLSVISMDEMNSQISQINE